jgi:polyhydroxyalkanoate synthesis regulator phasin
MKQFARPIPGQSLTDTPKNSPWERPPEIVEVGEVVRFYINKLADDDIMDDLAVTFEIGADLESVVETLMLTGTMKGIHTVEAGMLAGPAVGTFIKSAMSTYGIEVKETMLDPKEVKRKKSQDRIKRVLKEYLSRGDVEQDEGYALVQEMSQAAEGEMPEAQAPEEMPEVEVQEEAPRGGLMSKGDM